MAMSLTPLNAKDFSQVTDPERLTASRCLAILVSCTHVAKELKGNLRKPDEAKVTESLASLIFDIADHGKSLDSDLQTLATMLGCGLILTSGEEGVQN